MDSKEEQRRRRRRIECIRDRFLEGETPALVCTVMTGRFPTSPWSDNKKDQNQLASKPSTQLSTTNAAERQSITSSSPPPEPEETLASNLDDTTLEYDSDNERTIPYDVYDTENQNPEPEEVDIAISSSPPSRKLV